MNEQSGDVSKAVEKESCNDIQGPVIAKGLSK